MVIEELIAILTSNVELRELLKATAANSKISPNFSIEDGIAYTYADLTNDKIKRQGQFALTIVNADLLRAYKIKNKLDEILLTFADQPLTEKIVKVEQQGGGSYFDSDLNMQKLKVTYTITHRA